VMLHLDSRFFEERTIRSLTYAAPFAAPLAFTGLGLLLLANRLVDPDTPEWPRWILLLGLGGFIGNFVFSLTDHAQNAFFNPLEWVPVLSSAFAIGFLADTHQPAASFFERILNGAPPMAPLLFPNLVVLAAIALWKMEIAQPRL